MIQLDDNGMQHYLTEGFVTFPTDFPDVFHKSIYDRAEAIFESEGNPSNDIYPGIPELGEVFSHPRVVGALTAILGPGYMMHPHRHCHLTPPGKDPQRNHKDSYEDDANVRHHRSRWAMAFYYPQDVTQEIGPTAVTPGSQYYTRAESLNSIEEKMLCGPAGTVTIVHYDIWHRATENLTDRNRFMMKFLFCRMREPRAPAWDTLGQDVTFARHPTLCPHLWRWNSGQVSPRVDRDVSTLADQYVEGTEEERLDASYGLGEAGEVDILIERLSEEARTELDQNLERRHTNATQFDAAYGLGVAGAAAVPSMIDALSESDWWMRAAAADVLGDIGEPAAEAVPALATALEDGSEWVRRNATEALGTLRAKPAVVALGAALSDDSARVRHNAALSLLKIGASGEDIRPNLTTALEDENRYVRALSELALSNHRSMSSPLRYGQAITRSIRRCR